MIIVDDMISSGESMIEVMKELKSRGANRIFVFCTFALFTNGLAEFDKAFEEGLLTKLFSTNPGIPDAGALRPPILCKL